MICLALCASLLAEARVSDGTGFFALPESVWVEPGTCWALHDGDTLRAEPAARGSRTGLQVTPAPPPGDSVTLFFTRSPLSTASVARLDLRPLERTGPGPSGSQAASAPFQPGLVISGVKRLGFSVGRGGGLDQSTRIAVSGTLAPGIEVEGSLTDEDIPLGSSYSGTVSELDRITLAIDGAGWSADLGDMEWKRGATGPLAWRREVSGILGGVADSAGTGASGGLAVSGEAHRRAVFLTDEGVQGPYPFSGGAEVVPGSERVWLDGESLERGSSADYTIDNVTGTVTFTSRRLVRREQRVEVTYYSRGDGYVKDLYTASAGWGSGGFRIGAAGLFDADDRESPLGGGIPAGAAELLGTIGEDPDSAWIDGATWVGEGQGSYDLDSLGHFVYEGPGGGGWSVVFSRPPSSPGDYVYDSSTGGFAWAGESLGTHLPRQYLDIPSSLRLGGVFMDAESGSLSMDLEVAVSGRTGNTFNPDETTRQGSAVRSGLRLDLGEGDGLRLGVLAASGGFEPAGVWMSDSMLALWRLPVSYDGRDGMVELDGTAGPLRASGGLLLLGQGGRMARGRAGFSPEAWGVAFAAAAGLVSRSDSPDLGDGSRWDGGLEGTAVAGTVRPLAGFSLSREAWADSLDGPEAAFWSGAGIFTGAWASSLRLELERDWRASQTPLPSRVMRGRAETSGSGAGWRLEASAEHSRSEWEGGGSSDADAIGADLTLTGGSSWLHASYDGSGLLSSALEVRYVFVGEGEGSWSYDPETGFYFPDPDGDYDVYYVPGTGGVLAAEASLETEFMYGPATGPALEGSVDLTSRDAGTRLETFLLLGAAGSGSGGYRIDLSPLWRGSGTLRLARLRGVAARERTDYSGAGARTETERRLELSTRTVPLTGINLSTVAAVWRIEEDLYSPRRRDGLEASIDPSAELGMGFEPGLMLGADYRTEEYSSLSEVMYEIRPHFTWNWSGWTSSGSFLAGLIPGEGDLPSWFFDGSDRGASYTLQARAGRYVGSQLQLTLTAYARRPSGSVWVRTIGLDGAVSF